MPKQRPKNRGYVDRDEHGNVTIHVPPIVRGQSDGPVRVEVYLDTCLVSGLARRDLRPSEMTALRTLLGAHKAGLVALVTSRVTKDELGRLPEDKRAPHEDIYALLEDLPEATESRAAFQAGFMQEEMGGGVHDDELYARLTTMVPDVDDARHLFQAIKNGADYFVTDDERTIVSRAGAIEARYSIRVRLPSQLVAELAL